MGCDSRQCLMQAFGQCEPTVIFGGDDEVIVRGLGAER